jgi:RNA polymerase sigma factor (sigma-70 family)
MGKELLDRNDFIDLFRAGDEEASIALWEYGVEHYIPINRYLDFPDTDEEDIWTEVYVDFYETKCPTYDKSKGSFKWWARIVVKRAGWYKLRERQPFSHVSLEEYGEIPGLEKTDYEKISGKPESEARVKRAIEQLSEKYRVALWQKFYEGLSVDLIAKNLGITQAAVRMRISRGLQKLREILKGLKPRELQGRRKRAGQTDPSGVAST